jgi:hypothetical protein
VPMETSPRTSWTLMRCWRPIWEIGNFGFSGGHGWSLHDRTPINCLFRQVDIGSKRRRIQSRTLQWTARLHCPRVSSLDKARPWDSLSSCVSFLSDGACRLPDCLCSLVEKRVKSINGAHCRCHCRMVAGVPLLGLQWQTIRQ